MATRAPTASDATASYVHLNAHAELFVLPCDYTHDCPYCSNTLFVQVYCLTVPLSISGPISRLITDPDFNRTNLTDANKATMAGFIHQFKQFVMKFHPLAPLLRWAREGPVRYTAVLLPYCPPCTVHISLLFNVQTDADTVPNVTYNASNANRADMSIHLSMNPQQPYDVIFYISAEAALAAGSKDTQGRNFISINTNQFDVLAYTLLFPRGACKLLANCADLHVLTLCVCTQTTRLRSH